MNSFPGPNQVAKLGVNTKDHNGEITMCCGAQSFKGNIYCFDPYEHRPWQKCIENMYKDGVRIFSYLCPLVLGWDTENKYDFALLDKLHDSILQIVPEALLIPRVFLTTPFWWDKKYPDELLRFKKHTPKIDLDENKHQELWKYEAKMYHSTQNTSLASVQWKQDAGKALKAFIKHSMHKYHGHFIGFHLAYGTCGEWGPFGSYKNGRFGCYDFSKPMLKTFRKFLMNKYSDETALRVAWRDSQISFDSALPPNKAELLKTDYFTLKDPRFHQQCLDWYEHYNFTLAQSIGHFCRVVKKASSRPVLTAVFGGALMQTGASAYQVHSVFHCLDQILQEKDLDIICTPNWYENRQKGVASQAPVASISKKKLFIAECDVRATPDNANRLSTTFPVSKKEGIKNFCRDTFFNMSQGQGLFWWYDFGQGWFLSPEIRKIIRKIVSYQLTVLPEEKLQAEIAVVIDESSNSLMEGNCGYYRQFRKLLNHLLPYSGMPFDVITLDDMFTSAPHKLYIFRDLFYCEAITRNKLRDFVEKNNASCIWFFAAGTIDENGIFPDNSKSLTNIKLKVHETITTSAVTLTNNKHPFCENMQLPMPFSETSDIDSITAPVFSVDDFQAETLGQLESLELPGIACKYDSERFDLWSASPLLPSAFFANIACAAKCRQQAPSGVMTFGTGNMRMFLSLEKIKIKVAWGKAVANIRDLISGKIYSCRKKDFNLLLYPNRPVLLVEENTIN